jgi:hypothetical protein
MSTTMQWSREGIKSFSLLSKGNSQSEIAKHCKLIYLLSAEICILSKTTGTVQYQKIHWQNTTRRV